MVNSSRIPLNVTGPHISVSTGDYTKLPHYVQEKYTSNATLVDFYFVWLFDGVTAFRTFDVRELKRLLEG